MVRRVTAGMTTALLAVTLTACDNDPAGSATPPPFTPSTAPTSSPTPSDPAQSTAVAEAVTAYGQFIAAIDVAGTSGGQNVSELKKFASGAMLGAELNQAATFRAQKWHSVGRQKVVWAKALKIGVPDAIGQIDDITVQACVDTSQAIALDAHGKKVRAPGAPTQLIDEMRMRRSQRVWKADFSQSRKAGKC